MHASLRNRSIGLLAGLLLVLSAAPTALAQPAELTEEDVAPFLDGLFAAQLEGHHVAGATIAVVSNGEFLFTQGYGLADVEANVPVDPDETLFHLGSVTKLFTWTALMQQVQAGAVDLEADVSTYVAPALVPAAFDEPVTLYDLMHHTPGFEDRVIGLFVRGPDDLVPLADALADFTPSRIRPPGEVSAYSNYGVALAGRAVENVTSQSWDDYVEANILTPLDMKRTVLGRPIPEALADAVSDGYRWRNARFERDDLEYVPLAPAGQGFSTATDMGRFMLAHLGQGAYAGSRILSAETAQRMHAQSFAHDPLLPGMAHGFMEFDLNGERAIGHFGDTLLFHTLLVMVPERDLGVFVAYNSELGSLARQEFLTLFADRFLPRESEPEFVDLAQEQLTEFAGAYGPTRAVVTTAGRLATLFSGVTVQVVDNGLVTTTQGQATAWRPVQPAQPMQNRDDASPNGTAVFVDPDTGHRLVFVRQGGEVQRLYISWLPTTAWEPSPFYATANFQIGLLAASALILLAALLGWTVIWYVTRNRPTTTNHSAGWPAAIAKLIAGTMALISLVALFGIMAGLSDPLQILYGLPPGVETFASLGWIAIGLSVVVLVFAAVGWLKGWWGLLGRVFYSLVALAGLAFAWQLWYWNFVPLTV